MKFFVAAFLALAVVDAGVIVDRNGGNFAYSINTINLLPYGHHVLPYGAPFQLINPVEGKVVKPENTLLSFFNPYTPFLSSYPLINPVEGKSDTEPEKIETVALPSPYFYPAISGFSTHQFALPASSFMIGHNLIPVPTIQQVKEAAGEKPVEPAEVKPVDSIDAVVVETD